MSEYEAEVSLRCNDNTIVITAGSQKQEGWPEKVVEALVEYLRDANLLIGFVEVEKVVK